MNNDQSKYRDRIEGSQRPKVSPSFDRFRDYVSNSQEQQPDREKSYASNLNMDRNRRTGDKDKVEKVGSKLLRGPAASMPAGKAVNDQWKRMQELEKTTSPWGALKLTQQVQMKDMMPMNVALMAAIFVDLFDVATWWLIPLKFVVTIMGMILIWCMLYLVDSGNDWKQVRSVAKDYKMQRYLSVLGGSSVEAFFPGLNVLPFETGCVLLAYYLILFERRMAQIDQAK